MAGTVYPRQDFERFHLGTHTGPGLVSSMKTQTSPSECRLGLTRQRRRRVLSACSLALLLGLLLLISQPSCLNSDHRETDLAHVRLPTNVLPLHYVLDMKADLRSSEFSGTASISIQILESTRILELHANGLTLSNIHFKRPDLASPIYPRSTSYHRNDIVRLNMWRPLRVGNYTLVVPYSGVMGNRTMRGFYNSPYTNKLTGAAESVAATHFEPISARRAFPCFDEPHLKATFDMVIAVDKEMDVTSNMPPARIEYIASGKDEHAGRRFWFKRTPPMSTYLVAWAIGPLKSIRALSQNNVDVRVFAQPGRQAEAQYSLIIADICLYYFDFLFEIPFPLPKLDLWPIPDFGGEAMENFGLLIFEDRLLMYNESEYDPEAKQTTALLVAHEIGHQWFGDMVTMSWWDDLWLNEGFAEYMQFGAVASIDPSMDLQSQFFVMEHMLAFYADATSLSHPIASRIDNPTQIPLLFDDISYNKGASVIAMLEQFMRIRSPAEPRGPFARGITEYLHRHSYGSATTSDLWAALDSVLEADGREPVVAQMMRTWVSQPGHPVIKVNFDNDELVLTQCRFSLWREGPDCTTELLYFVPFTYITISLSTYEKSNVELVTFVRRNSSDSSSKLWHRDSSPVLLLANPDRTGLYRTHYSSQEYEKIGEVLLVRPDILSTEDRAGLLSDALALTLSNHVSFGKTQPLLQFLRDERSATVWIAALDGLGGIYAAIERDDTLASEFQLASQELVNDVAMWVGWTDDRQTRDVDRMEDTKERREKTMMRRAILEWAIKHFEKEHPLIQQGLAYYDTIVEHSKQKPADPLPATRMLDLVYQTAIFHNHKQAFRYLLNAHVTKSDRCPGNILDALATTQDPFQQQQLWAAVAGQKWQPYTLKLMCPQRHACSLLLSDDIIHTFAMISRMVNDALEVCVARCSEHPDSIALVKRIVNDHRHHRRPVRVHHQNDDPLYASRVLALRKGLERAHAADKFLDTARNGDRFMNV
ncbi:hypothetical protein PhCBS80983_g01608 [Powellomyces hirtus]|uniref:Aminopeptidase n=1 Tax=Powellomyces hirtus TaxID=109895 RepID=A0A507E9G2_9FUNG|nr:hypothetical protein PhCBS80983_g01608 [Powellomyces hirtus]